MAEEMTPNPLTPEDPELFKSFIRDNDQQGIFMGGPIPEEWYERQEGASYEPSREERITGIKFALEAAARYAQMRASVLYEIFDKSLQQKDE